MGFLVFALKCFDVLAWPLISLGYPLCASVRAIEVNSNSDMQKLITYWILYSLISLFELGFSKLIEWIPFWPCIKLMAISYLVLHRFNGAYHVYGCLVHPYFHVNPQVVINKFNKLKELSHNGENFLAMADKYVEENGLEALVKLIASKSKGTKPSYDVEEIKAFSNAEKREVVATIQSKCKDPIVVQKDIKAVEQTEKNTVVAAKSKGEDPIVVQKEIKAVEQTEKNAAAAARVKNGEQNLVYAEKKTDATVGIKQTTATSVAGGENKLLEVTTSENIQKEWTCAVCQSTCSSEKDLNSHLQGWKHRAKCEELKASNAKDPIVVQKDIKAVEQTDKNAAAAAKSKCKDPALVRKDSKAVEQTEKNAAAAAKVKNGEQNIAYAEKKTDATVGIKQTTTTSVAGGENKLPEVTTSKNIQREWTYAVCQSTCTSEKDLNSHLQGWKHKAKCEDLKASNGKDPIVVQKDIKAVEQDKNATSAAKKDVKAVEQTEKNAAAAAKVKNGEQKPAYAEKKTDATVGIKRTTTASVAGGENKLPEVTTSKNIQKEWTCAVCQLTCTSEKDLNSHLQGRRHRAKWEELKASNGKDPIIVQKDIKAVEQIDKNAAAADKSKCKDPVVQKDIKAVEQIKKNAAAAAKVKNGVQNLAYAEKKTDATVGIKQTTTTSVAGGENKLPEVTTSKNIHKKWTCGVCQSTCSSEKNLNSHLQGKKHRAKCEELKASKQTDKNKGSSSMTANKSDQANQEPEKRKLSQVNSCNQSNPKNAGTQMQQSQFCCSICNVRCSGEIDMASHLNGSNHLSQVLDMLWRNRSHGQSP